MKDQMQKHGGKDERLAKKVMHYLYYFDKKMDTSKKLMSNQVAVEVKVCK